MNEKLIYLLSLHIINEINPGVIDGGSQALTWGLSGALSTKFTQDKAKNKEEKIKQLKQIVASGVSGAAAGAIGHYLSNQK